MHFALPTVTYHRARNPLSRAGAGPCMSRRGALHKPISARSFRRLLLFVHHPRLTWGKCYKKIRHLRVARNVASRSGIQPNLSRINDRSSDRKFRRSGKMSTRGKCHRVVVGNLIPGTFDPTNPARQFSGTDVIILETRHSIAPRRINYTFSTPFPLKHRATPSSTRFSRIS